MQKVRQWWLQMSLESIFCSPPGSLFPNAEHRATELGSDSSSLSLPAMGLVNLSLRTLLRQQQWMSGLLLEGLGVFQEDSRL